MKLQIEYFAILKDQSGRSGETIDSEAANPSELYRELSNRHGFTLPQSALKVAINEDFADWDVTLSEGDTIVFIPPVAGG
ncbi:MAG: molybdopterin synthase sulfur carrier subunit [Opitutales bacterium TMED158]|nr:MAG: molybdopterin synthase sulfur carrier subunit [Opitutales bacterium TMED158]